MCKVTVITSAYNAGNFLRRCLDSLKSQTLSDLQLVCVDDCSTDDTLDIMQEYAARDSRFLVIPLEQNIGFVKARNIALQYATGEYVCTLDADDWFGTDAMQLAVEVFDRHPLTDCVLLQMVYVDDATGQETVFPMDGFEVLTGTEAMRRSLKWDGIHGLYLTRTSLHKEIPFDDTTRVYSDENTSRCHFLMSREVRQCPGKYYYWQHGQSATHRVSASYFDYLRATEHLLADLRRLGADEETQCCLTDMLWLRVIDCYAFAFVHRGILTTEEHRHGMAEIRRTWEHLDLSRLSAVRYKIGHMPLRCSWWLFRLQEEIYFSLRGLFGRNPKP